MLTKNLTIGFLIFGNRRRLNTGLKSYSTTSGFVSSTLSSWFSSITTSVEIDEGKTRSRSGRFGFSH